MAVNRKVRLHFTATCTACCTSAVRCSGGGKEHNAYRHCRDQKIFPPSMAAHCVWCNFPWKFRTTITIRVIVGKFGNHFHYFQCWRSNNNINVGTDWFYDDDRNFFLYVILSYFRAVKISRFSSFRLWLITYHVFALELGKAHSTFL